MFSVDAVIVWFGKLFFKEKRTYKVYGYTYLVREVIFEVERYEKV